MFDISAAHRGLLSSPTDFSVELQTDSSWSSPGLHQSIKVTEAGSSSRPTRLSSGDSKQGSYSPTEKMGAETNQTF